MDNRSVRDTLNKGRADGAVHRSGKSQVTRLPKKLELRLENFSDRWGVTKAAVVRAALSNFLDSTEGINPWEK